MPVTRETDASPGGHPKAAGIRERVDQHRSFWLRGYYGLLGQAYLTLVPALTVANTAG